jgi:hypothetical protein
MTILKAYAVTENDENTGGIFYAAHAIVARRDGADEHNDGQLGSVSCRRAPWADKYAPGPCPKLVMIDHGWWFECHGCGARLSDDGDLEANGYLDPKKFIEVGTSVYCSAECRIPYRRERAQRLRLERAAIRDLAARLLTILPAVKPITLRGKNSFRPHAYVVKQGDGTWVTQQCMVNFEWPGMKIGPGTFRFDKVGEKPHVAICHGDLEAWNAWRAAK